MSQAKKLKILPVLLSVIMAFVSFIYGCEAKKPEQTAKLVAKKPEPSLKFDPAARASEIKTRVILSYTHAGKRDPFKSLIKETAPDDSKKKESVKGLSLLESYDVSSFKLIGIISTDDGNVAMLVAPDGKGFMVRKGTHIGLNDGEITQIDLNYVQVVEMIENYTYRGELEVTPQTTYLELRKEEER